MHKPFAFRSFQTTPVLAAIAAVVISVALLGGVAGLFQRDGALLESAVIAERACSDHAYASERDACMRAFLAAGRTKNVAAR